MHDLNDNFAEAITQYMDDKDTNIISTTTALVSTAQRDTKMKANHNSPNIITQTYSVHVNQGT